MTCLIHAISTISLNVLTNHHVRGILCIFVHIIIMIDDTFVMIDGTIFEHWSVLFINFTKFHFYFAVITQLCQLVSNLSNFLGMLSQFN
jgi:hypothetical protein